MKISGFLLLVLTVMACGKKNTDTPAEAMESLLTISDASQARDAHQATNDR
jgi:hypothetical protein